MVALLSKQKMDQADTDRSGENKPETLNQDSPMVSSVGEQSGTSSPSAGEMSVAEDFATATVARPAAVGDAALSLSQQDHPPGVLQTADQLIALAATIAKQGEASISPPVTVATDIKTAAATTEIMSYKSLEGKLLGVRSSSESSSEHSQSKPSSMLVDALASAGEGRGRTANVKTGRRGYSRSTSRPKKATNLRRGKWTVEEEAYVARVIQDFNSGFLNAPAGTTLRTYLSEKLKCDPMRITKKFTGDACIGKRVFHPAVRSPANAGAIDKAQAELDSLERRWRRRLEMQQRESAKKAAASAAVAAAASSSRSMSERSLSGEIPEGVAPKSSIARTASWLDRAKSALVDSTQEDQSDETTEIQHQIQEVQRLIHEGPVIQQTSADIPQIFDREQDDGQDASQATAESNEAEPADKRLRTDEDDAEALVGFLRSVRASAASGETL